MSCQWVDLAELYANPIPYAEAEICTEGILQEWFPSVLLVPHRLDDDEAGFQNLKLAWGETAPRNFRDGDRVRVRGRFSYFEDCYEFYVVHDGDMGDTAMFCGPPDVPMHLEVISIERTSR